jgi:hypothetical protein
MEIREKHEPRFLEGLRASKETLSKKRLEKGKKKGKKQVQEFGFEMQDKKDVPIQS